MLVINPSECIDCGVCEPECPAEAIIREVDDPDKKWLSLNEKYSEIWPNITVKGTPPEDAEEWQLVDNKFEDHFSEKPGTGE